MLHETYHVEKSNRLILSQLSVYSVYALKALDIYLSRINAREPDTINVAFSKREFCRVMGIHENAKPGALKKALRELRKADIAVYAEDERYKGVRYANLFKTADIIMDKVSKKMFVVLHGNDDLAELFFNLKEGIGYTEYSLRNTISLNSKTSILLYNILKMRLSVSRKASSEAEFTIDELRTQLGATSRTNEEFKYFRRLIDRSCSEVSDKTDIQVEYVVLRDWKSARAIRFRVSLKAQRDVQAGQDALPFDEAPPADGIIPSFEDLEPAGVSASRMWDLGD